MFELIFIIIVLNNSIFCELIDNPIVDTNNGRIQGTRCLYKDGFINVFKGIPYSEPPIGDLRFKRPMPKAHWKDIYEAFEFGSECKQRFQSENMTSENCLFLNIWTPNLNQTRNLPVMIWIHGGRYSIGSGTETDNFGINQFDGTELSSRGVVVITINYRLGIFGYLYSGTDEAPGNMGLYDMLLSFQWAIDNAVAFGGNPDDITIFGNSCGGWAISAFIISPFASTLFQKAIIESGTSYNKLFLTDTDSALQTSISFANNKTLFTDPNCQTNDFVECLKNIPADDLVNAEAVVANQFSIDTPYFKPVYGTNLMPLSPIEALRTGKFKTRVKLLAGHQEMEGLNQVRFISDQGTTQRYNQSIAFNTDLSLIKVKRDIKNTFVIMNNTKGDRIADAYTAPFTNYGIQNFWEQNKGIRRSACYSGGDFVFVCPTVLFCAKMVSYKGFLGNVYQYRLSYANSRSPSYGSKWALNTHLDELPLVFGRPLRESNWTEDDMTLSEVMVNVWTDFAKYGRPPVVNGNIWPPYRVSAEGIPIASYLELHPSPKRLGRIFINKYRGKDGYCPFVVNNCFNFWDSIYIQQFSY